MPDLGRVVPGLRAQLPTVVAALLLLGYGVVNPSPAGLALGVNIAVAAIACIGLTLTIGTAGQLALGQAGFMAIGAYGTAYLMHARGLTFVVAVVSSLVVTVIIGTIVGYIALRLNGNYLAMATLAVGSAIYALLVLPNAVGGANGYAPIPPPSIAGHAFIQPAEQYYLIAVVLILVLAGARLWLRSSAGRELVAMRDDEVAARSVGINVTVRKVQIFAITALLGGLAGAVNAPIQSAIDPFLFSPMVSLQIFVMVILGGLGNIYGAVLGAALVIWLNTAVSGNGSWALTILGVIVVVFMAVVPDGFAAVGRILRKTLGRLAAQPKSPATDPVPAPEDVGVAR